MINSNFFVRDRPHFERGIVLLKGNFDNNIHAQLKREGQGYAFRNTWGTIKGAMLFARQRKL